MNPLHPHEDTSAITVLLIDQNPICRDGIKSMLSGTEFHVVGEAASGADGLRQARALQPNLVLLDVQLEDGVAWQTLRVLREDHSPTPMLMLSTYDNPIYMARATAEGAAGYLLKSAGRDEFLVALRAVVSGETLLPSPQSDFSARHERISVLLVDDHALWRHGVRSMLLPTEFEVVGEAESSIEAIDKVRELQPQIMLLDIHMAGGDGLDALQAMKAELPQMAVVMLTSYDNPEFVARAVVGGVAGYLLKGISFAELLAALRAVAEGEMLLSPEDLMRSLHAISPEAAQSTDLVYPLSPRELEVLGLLAMGLSNKEIASLLFIGESTVKTHVSHLISKLNVSDRVQAVVWAARHGLLPPVEPGNST